MKHRPQLPCWNVAVFQFIFYCTERLYHDALSHFAVLVVIIVAIISPWSDESIVPPVRLAVADDDDSEHVHILRVELLQSGNSNVLLVASSLSDEAYNIVFTPVFLKQFLQPVELPVSAVALRIVHRRYEVSLGSSLYSLLYQLPRSHEVAHGNDAEVMAHRSTEERSCLLESAYSRYGDDFHIGASVAFHLIDKWCHTIDAGVSA